jgi:AraC-like DNA-binding protein
MQYQEFQPKPVFSHHIECFWQMTLMPGDVESRYEMWSPDCTFDVVFSDRSFQLKFATGKPPVKVSSGGVFIGQKTSCVQFCTAATVRLFGIRFKPFAFAHLPEIPLSRLNDLALPLDKLFTLTGEEKRLAGRIPKVDEAGEKIDMAEKLLPALLRDSGEVDQTFRAQVNYILDRKGVVQIQDLFTEFGISKVTLNNHFVRKMGLSPKKVSRIWRLNYFLQLQKDVPHFNLTQLCLEAGYYDQAHFIKEFRGFFNHSPQDLLRENSQLLRISQEIIARRFTNQYDPR